MIDVVTVCAGGGSIAWVSPDCSLKVGPRSAVRREPTADRCVPAGAAPR